MEATLWPYGKCEKCANKNYCAWSESEILNCMNNDYPNFSPMRNADRIRAMTDEELADLYMRAIEDEEYPGWWGNRMGLLAWLKQEAKDDGSAI